jgi:hypothetical protein
MAVEHPVAWIVCNELYVSSLGDSDEHRVAWPPGCLRDAASFSAGRIEGVPVDMYRVMIHAEVYKTRPYSVALANNEGRGGWTGLAVQQKPVELHHHRVGDGRICKDRILLQMDRKVFIAMRTVGYSRVHDERTQHSGQLLHRYMRMVEIRSFLLDEEVVCKTLTGMDRLLADAGHPVVSDLIFKTMPVKGTGLRQFVLEDHPDLIVLRDLDGRAGRGAVEAPDIDRFIRSNLLLKTWAVRRKTLTSPSISYGRSPTSVVTTGVFLTKPRCKSTLDREPLLTPK